MVLEKTLETLLDSKRIKPVNPKGNHSLEKTPVLVNIEGQEDKGATEDKMVGWHHQLNGHEFEQALGDGKGQGSLSYCSPWVSKSQT